MKQLNYVFENFGKFIPWCFTLSFLLVCLFYHNVFIIAREQNQKEKDRLRNELEKPTSNFVEALTEKSGSTKQKVSAPQFYEQSDWTPIDPWVPLSQADSLDRLRSKASLVKERKSVQSSWKQPLVLGVGLFLLIAVYFHLSQQKIADLYEQDKDPEILGEIFVQNNDNILSLGSPRKIKRFSNRVRFQYYLFGLARPEISRTQLQFFFNSLLFYEMNRKELNHRVQPADNADMPDISDPDIRALVLFKKKLYAYLKEDNHEHSSEASILLERIHEFNKNTIV